MLRWPVNKDGADNNAKKAQSSLRDVEYELCEQTEVDHPLVWLRWLASIATAVAAVTVGSDRSGRAGSGLGRAQLAVRFGESALFRVVCVRYRRAPDRFQECRTGSDAAKMITDLSYTM